MVIQIKKLKKHKKCDKNHIFGSYSHSKAP